MLTPRLLMTVALLGACASPDLASTSSALTTSIISELPESPTFSTSTVPPSGDVNPYGVAFVPDGFPTDGTIQPGDVLVSNFNNSSNAQGTGSSIVAVHPDGTQSLFFQGPPGLGLSTALAVLRGGFVIVGNVPSLDGSGVCTQRGANEVGVGSGMLTVLDRNGNVVQTFSHARFLDGPWDMTVHDEGDRATLFVSNALSGTVARWQVAVGDSGLTVLARGQIASGYVHRCDPAAFVIGPTGLALDEASGTLYVASTGDNAIFAIDNALERPGNNARRGTVFIADSHLRGPLGLAIAPNGNFLTTQGDAINGDPNFPSELVEYDPAGNFLNQMSIDQAQGSAFGLAIVPNGAGFILAAVDDAINVLDVWVVD